MLEQIKLVVSQLRLVLLCALRKLTIMIASQFYYALNYLFILLLPSVLISVFLVLAKTNLCYVPTFREMSCIMRIIPSSLYFMTMCTL